MSDSDKMGLDDAALEKELLDEGDSSLLNKTEDSSDVLVKFMENMNSMTQAMSKTLKRINDAVDNGPSTKRSALDHDLSDSDGDVPNDQGKDEDDDNAVVSSLFAASDATQPSTSGESTHWLEEFKHEEAEEHKGPDVNGTIASLGNKRFQKSQSLEKVKKLQDKYATPGNCTDINVPRVNPEVWSKLRLPNNKALKNRDLKLMNIQRAMTGAATAMLRVMDNVSSASRSGAEAPDFKELFQTALDALSLVGHANYEISMRRREGLVPIMKQDYAYLCHNRELPVTNLLFGNEFSNAMKDAKKVAYMGRDMGRNDQRNTYGRPKNWQGHQKFHKKQWKGNNNKHKGQYRKDN